MPPQTCIKVWLFAILLLTAFFEHNSAIGQGVMPQPQPQPQQIPGTPPQIVAVPLCAWATGNSFVCPQPIPPGMGVVGLACAVNGYAVSCPQPERSGMLSRMSPGPGQSSGGFVNPGYVNGTVSNDPVPNNFRGWPQERSLIENRPFPYGGGCPRPPCRGFGLD